MNSIEITVEVDLEGTIVPGTKDSYVGEQWYPGDPADVENFKVTMSRFVKRRGFIDDHTETIDLTPFLDEKQIEQLKNEYLDIEEK